MANCWSIGISLIFCLGSLCLWNCFTRDEAKNSKDWYGCIDQLGEPTDFFTIYKLPHEKKSSIPNVRDGTAYIYLTPDSETRLQSGGVSSVLSYSDSSSHWVLSNVSIGDEKSMPGKTLRRLYQDRSYRTDETMFIMYNDESPAGHVSFTGGHSKGVLVLGELGGYWLVHSVPKYPPNPHQEGYYYPMSAHRYGQSMLCISLPPVSHALVQSIGSHLIQNEVHAYSWTIPPKMGAEYPLLEEAVKGGKGGGVAPFYKVTQITSSLGKAFTAFAKGTLFNQDLYSGLVSPILKANLYVETWRNGVGPLPSECNGTFIVENISSVGVSSLSLSFSTHHDHSKWAVSGVAERPYVCVGDINRMETQLKRGGGTVCIWSLSVWYRFKSLVLTRDQCYNRYRINGPVF